MDHAQIPNSHLAQDDFCQFFAETNLPQEENPRIDPDVQVVLNSLFIAYKRLRNASYRIGYLEGQVKKYRQLIRTAADSTHRLDATRRERAPEAVTEYEAPRVEKTWLSFVVEAIVGPEEPTARNDRRSNRVSSNQNYYQLIRKSIEL
jgi:hypothetical protein